MKEIEEILNIFEVQVIIRIILGLILSGIIGMERESWSKPAGFRTHTLVGMSAVLVMICGIYLYNEYDVDLTRIPAQLLSGIGFVGAGTILRDGFNVKGLTTAASLLTVTCIGVSIGAGFYLAGVIATVIVYIILSCSHVISDKLDHYMSFEFDIKTDEPKSIIRDVQMILEKYKIIMEDIKIIENEIDGKIEKSVKLTGKHSEDVSKNKLISKFLLIDTVTQVIASENVKK